MELTLKEDKGIVENIYPEYQHGFMNARYDKQASTRSMGEVGDRSYRLWGHACRVLLLAPLI